MTNPARGPASRNKRTLVILFVGISCCVPLPAVAAGQVYLSWDQCPIMRTYDQTIQGEGGFASVWVTGLDEPHCAYKAVLVLASADGGSLPDAWRFDDFGCQGMGQRSIERGPPLVPTTCSDPLRTQPDSLSVQIGMTYDPLTGRATAELTASYSPCETNVEVLRRYYLARFGFYYTKTVSGPSTPGLCGGAERQVCIWVSEASYKSPNGEWVSWGRENAAIEAGAAAMPALSCDATAVQSRTWGQLKGVYR